MKSFTEKDTEEFYDKEDEIYQSFWDDKGSLHWGLFEKDNDMYIEASENLTKYMINLSRIDNSSEVLDLGCGNGEVSIQLVKKCNCNVRGIDLSNVRIQNAISKLKTEPEDIQEKIVFQKATATKLPFEDYTFSHVWSQATIYHVHDKEKSLKEIYRVLKRDGIFIFDDLLKPKKDISKNSEKYIYERLLFDTPFNFLSYKKFLEKIGFVVIESKDISNHLLKSYKLLKKIIEKKLSDSSNKKHKIKYEELNYSYEKMISALNNNELGWGIYLCKKK